MRIGLGQVIDLIFSTDESPTRGKTLRRQGNYPLGRVQTESTNAASKNESSVSRLQRDEDEAGEFSINVVAILTCLPSQWLLGHLGRVIRFTHRSLSSRTFHSIDRR